MKQTRTFQRRLGWRVGAAAACVAMGATSAVTATPSPASAAGLATIKVAMVPKLLGLPVFEANQKGALSVVHELGISFKFTAPATASAEGQVSIFNSLIAQHYNVITLSADDPTVPVPVLQKAMKAGIQVISYDSDVAQSARDFFIQDTAYNTIAQGVIDAAVKFAGPNADVAIMSSTPDATIQLAWIGAMKSYIAARYPHLKIVTIGYGQSNQATSLSQAEGIIHSYPNVKAILPIDGAAVVGTAQAVAALHESGKIGVFGIGDPLPNQKYFADGSMQGLFLWNEVGQGKLTMLMARLAYEGAHGAPECTAKTPPAHPSPSQWCGIRTNYGRAQYFNGAAVGLPGTYSIAAKANKVSGATRNTVIFSKPLEFTRSNYKKYDF